MIVETLNQETIYRGHAFNVRRDDVRFPNQHIAHLDIIEHVGAVDHHADRCGRAHLVCTPVPACHR